VDPSQRLALVEECLNELPPEERTLLLFVLHARRPACASFARQKMSQELGITPALLRTRVSRLLSAFNRRVRTLAEEACARLTAGARRVFAPADAFMAISLLRMRRF